VPGVTLPSLLIVAALALLAPVSAFSANEPHPTLDAVASEIAGSPATVWCEADRAGWRALTAATGLAGGARAFVRWTPAGPEPVAYLGPDACLTLRERLLRPDRPISAETIGPALLTFLHEAVHLSGVRDEAVADCTALALVKRYAVRSFGYAETVARTRRVVRSQSVTRDGKRIRMRVVRRVRVLIANPELADLYAAALRDHRLRPAAYQGWC
jgi:hypothetical protein